MKKNLLIKAVLLSGAAWLVFLLAGCEYKGPVAIWNPNQSLGVYPIILSVEPTDNADAGILEIKIRGLNFPLDTSKSTIYFNNQKALIKSISSIAGDTSEIVVYRPNISGDALTIKVIVDSTYAIGSQSNYGVSEVARLYGKLTSKNYVKFLAVDAQDNLYIATVADIRKIDTHELMSSFGTLRYNKKVLKLSDMKTGPDDAVYLQTIKGTTLYKVTASDSVSVPEVYANFDSTVSYFDFDKNGNVYGGGDKVGLYVIKSDMSSQAVGDCNDLTILAVRVYNDAVYVATASDIWRCPILGPDGSLGNKEHVVDMTQLPDYSASKILSFIMEESGDFYISTDHSDAVFIYRTQSGITEALYKGILLSNGGQLVWGGGSYFYLNMIQVGATADVMRITTGKVAAPK